MNDSVERFTRKKPLQTKITTFSRGESPEHETVVVEAVRLKDARVLRLKIEGDLAYVGLTEEQCVELAAQLLSIRK
jgi:hypothetical protein